MGVIKTQCVQPTWKTDATWQHGANITYEQLNNISVREEEMLVIADKSIMPAFTSIGLQCRIPPLKQVLGKIHIPGEPTADSSD